jgi:hypothetical protein
LDVPHVKCAAEPSRFARANGWTGKSLGYLVSIASVFFLGAIAWPKPNDSWWHLPALGMATSILGMACRHKEHLDQQPEIKKPEAEAKRA